MREEFAEKNNLHKLYLSYDIDNVIDQILKNPNEDLIHQLMYYVELRTLRYAVKELSIQSALNTLNELKQKES